MASLDAKTKKKKASVVDQGSEKKARRIVSWTDQEDAMLREQIGVHGTENWTAIASMFEDKTTRQCRRRWYTYLNSDFKKGGWSPQEDMLLCEAQKIFGNRWTEIAKVVPGRTDNAVKNRFTTLCKKRAKSEGLKKETTTSYINQNNKRVLIRTGSSTHETSENAASLKRLRESHIPALPENCNDDGKLLTKCGKTMLQQLRPPFSVLAQNFHNIGNLLIQHHPKNVKEPSNDVQDNMIQGIFLKKDEVTDLMQQAELLSSLAVKVNTGGTDQSLENSWKFLQDFLSQNKENDMLELKFATMDLQLGSPKESADDIRSSHMGSRSSWRQPPESCEDSQGSSEYSTGSTLLTQTGDRTDETQAEFCGVHQGVGVGLQSVTEEVQNDCDECRNGIDSSTPNQEEIFLSFDEPGNNDGIVSVVSSTEFSSPLQVTPLFQSLAAGIPSPKFSESERHFLLKTLGLESPSANPSTANPSQPPPCRRALLNSL